MSEKRDPAIKLFGKTIQLGSNLNGDTSTALMVDVDCECVNSDQNMPCSKQSENRGDEKVPIGHQMQEEEPSSSSGLEGSKTLAIPSTTTIENPKPLSNDKESSSQDLYKKEDESNQTSSNHNSQEQCPPKKPDKILPCPRCNSMDTKFCYFNNYNVNQPRHFCKNCQRYWTAGGSMRNVPVGAGRRKNKTSSSSVSQPNGLIQHGLRPNGTLLAFGSDSHSPLPESMASMLKLAEKSPICPPNGFIEPETRNVNESSNTSLDNNPMVCFSGSSWPYTWNPIPFPSGFPVSFYPPPPYLQWVPTTPIFPDQSSETSNPDSPSLGKHSREEKRLESSRVVIPKTLRIDDPTDAAKSSIWSTLEIKNDKVVGSSNVVGGFFRGFELTKDVDNQHGNLSDEGSSMALQANPAAFSRSLSFHENA